MIRLRPNIHRQKLVKFIVTTNMNSPAFSVVRTTQSVAEADLMISALQRAGLHPVELSLASHVSHYGVDFSFPIQVPTEEATTRSEEHTSELQSQSNLVC